MKTILVASSKGGVGKTTIATHLAAQSALSGKRTVLVDADPQRSSTRWAATYWREKVKAGETVDARIINTSSTSGIFGNPGQTNYGAAKAGIASFTIIAARELGRYGITVNAIAPAALTRMTENLGGMAAAAKDIPADKFNRMSADNIAPLVVWLASDQSKEITGRVFLVSGGRIAVAEGWNPGPSQDKGDRWDPAELGDVVPKLVAQAAPITGMQ